MKVSKDLYVSQNEEVSGLVIFSNSLGKGITVNPEEILPLINALQAEYASKQICTADALPCGHTQDHESMLLETGEFVCDQCGAIHR